MKFKLQQKFAKMTQFTANNRNFKKDKQETSSFEPRDTDVMLIVKKELV